MPFATHPNYLEIIRAPGYLYWEPTSLASEAGYGVQLGFTEEGVTFNPGYNVQRLRGEEKGEEWILKIFTGVTPQIFAVLKNYNATSLPRIFPGLVSATNIQYPGSILPGTDLFSAYTGKLLFVPVDTINNPIMIGQQVAPNITDSFKFSNALDTNFAVVFDCKRKTNDADGIVYNGNIAGGILR